MADLGIIYWLSYVMSFISLYMVIFWILLIRSKDDLDKQPEEPKRFPKVSVLIPAHNEEETIKKAVNSVLASNYPKNKLEAIVIANGCKDRTVEFAKSIKSKRVRVFSREEANKASAVNYGIEKATGEFIAVMDADSYIDKVAIRKMVPHLEEENVAAVIPVVEIDNPKKFIQKIQWCEYLIAQFMYKLLSVIGALYVTPGVLSIYKKDIVKKVGGFDKTSITEDAEIATRLQYNGYDIKSEVNGKGYTKGPDTWKALYKQRLRWTRGLIDIIKKYRSMWFTRKYGHLGSFVMPMIIIIAILSTSLFVVIFLGLFMMRNEYINAFETFIFNFLNPSSFQLTIETISTFILSRNILLYFLTAALLIAGLTIFNEIRKVLKKKNIYILPLIVFLTYYQLFLTSQWVVAIAFEALRIKKKW